MGMPGSRRDPAERVQREAEEPGSGRRFRRKAETEPGGLWDDAAMQEQGVGKILTINRSDLAKKLNIR